MAEKKTESVQAKPDKVTRPEKVKILIPWTSSEDRPLICGINGVNYSIPRGKEVEVPFEVAELIWDIQRREREVYAAETENRKPKETYI